MSVDTVKKDFKSQFTLGKVLAGITIVILTGVVIYYARKVSILNKGISKVPGNQTTGV